MILLQKNVVPARQGKGQILMRSVAAPVVTNSNLYIRKE